MNAEPSLLKRRRLSPEKLRAARLRAGFSNVAEVVRLIGFQRLGYRRWENTALPGLTHFDFIAMHNVLTLFGVVYEDVTDPLEPAQKRSRKSKRNGAAHD